MCGFVGFKSAKDYDNLKDALSFAADVLVHRGPDDTGLYFDHDAGVGLAHRRLSIIDLSNAGHQPMCSDDGRVQIVYNGEVYNFTDVREVLEDLGYKFRSGTDTEVLLKAYLQWGIECLIRFNGMFALAIWDSRNQTLFLARDRIGIKPLYYYFDHRTFIFASELKAIMAFKHINLNIDADAVPLFLHYQYVPAPKTIFQNTYKLLPGTYLKYSGTTLCNESFWEIPHSYSENPAQTLPEDEALDRLEVLLSSAVSDRLISDVPLGALLSGGIDSSTVVALMQRVRKSAVKTFSIGFQEPEYNEAPWASRIADYLGTDHTELYVTPKDALEVVPQLPDIYDEPFADQSAIPTFLVCKLAKTQLTVALSGDGGDEQFAGYIRYWTTEAMFKNWQYLPRVLKKTLVSILKKIPVSWAEKCYLPWRKYLPQKFKVANFEDKWFRLINLINKSELSDLYRMTICLWPETELRRMTGLQLPQSNYEEIFEKTKEWPLLARLMRVDQGTYLPDAMLTKVDRASMAVSLEVRVPLLDHRVIEYTSTLPVNLKFHEGIGKYLLKRLLARYLPTELFERPKMGFGIPIDLWFRGELKPLLMDYLSKDRLKREGLFNPDIVSDKIKEHLTEQANHQYRLWPLLMWQMWRERWLG